MQSIHRRLCAGNYFYKSWHQNNTHQIGHWAVFISVFFITLLSLFSNYLDYKTGEIALNDWLRPHSAYAASTDLILHLAFDEGAGATTYDASDNGNNAVLTNGASWTTGKVGEFALQLDGSNDHVKIDNTSYTGYGAVTQAVWINQSMSSGHGAGWILGGTGQQQRIFADRNNNRICYVNNGSTGNTVCTNFNTYTPGQWRHIALTRTADYSSVKIYIDGVAYDLGGIGNLTNTPNWSVGAPYDIPSAVPFGGAIDDFRIYNRVLSEAEIQQLIDLAGSSIPPPGDSTEPTISAGSPSGAFAAGTTQTTISVTTDEAANCKYGTSVNTPYNFISDTFAVTGGVSHSSVLTGLSNGSFYTYYIRCEDVSGNSNESDYPISFSVDNSTQPSAGDVTSPTVAISSPAGGATVSGTVTISATASDNSGIAGVQFKLDGDNLGIEDLSSPYTVSWNTTQTSNGSHILTAIARDAAGNTAQANAVSVSVSNTVVGGGIYYVSNSGNDSNSGSINQPWKTIQKAVNTVQAGDTIYVRGGTYNKFVPIGWSATWNVGNSYDGSSAKSGTASKPITLKAYPGEQVVWMTDPNMPVNDQRRYEMIDIRGRSYWHIEGFTFDHKDKPGPSWWWYYGIHINGDSDGIQIKNNTFKGNSIIRPGGVIVSIGHDGSGVDNALVENNSFIDWPSPSDLQGVQLESRSLQTRFPSEESIPLNKNVIIRNNTFRNIGGDCVQAGPWSSKDLLVEGNTCTAVYNDYTYSTAENFIDIKAKNNGTIIRGNIASGFRSKPSGGGPAILIHIIAQDITVEDNILYDNAIGIAVSESNPDYAIPTPQWYKDIGGDKEVRNIIIRRNLIFDSNFKKSYNGTAGSGIGIWAGGINNLKIYNNTIAHSAEAAIHLENNDGVDIKNNLVLDTGRYFIREWSNYSPYADWGNRITIGKNHFADPAMKIVYRKNNGDFVNYNIADFQEVTQQALGSTFGDPLLVNPTISYGNANYNLKSNSPAINVGEILSGISYYGSKPDMGAFEYGEATTQPSAGDVTSPTVAISSPAGGATVSGTVTISATASDNSGIAGVQFKLDGDNLGIEDLSSPYTVSWNTTQTSNGSHILTAIARDAAGNTAQANAVSVSVSNQSTLEPSLVGYWSFNENSGITAADVSVKGNNLTLFGNPSWTSGRVNNALALNGNASYAHKSLLSSGSWQGDYTVSFWVKAGQLGQSQYTSVFNNNSGSAVYDSFQIDVDGQNPGTYRFNSNNNYSIAPVSSNWQHLTVTLNGTNLKTYNNGALTHTYTLSSGESNNFRDYVVGVNRVGSAFFNGLVDELRIYNYALDEQGVLNLYNSTPPPPDETAPVITSVAAGSLSQNSAVITWTTNEPATSKVEYGRTTSYEASGSINTSLTTSHSVTLTSLSAGTTYNFRVRSQDTAGNEAVSINVMFITINPVVPDVVPPSAITDLQATNITQTSVDLLSWTAPGDDGNISAAASYDIRYTTGNLTDENFIQAIHASGEPVPKAAGADQSYTLVGLIPATTYQVAMTSTDSAGNTSALSNVVTFTTLKEAVPIPPDSGSGQNNDSGASGGSGGSGGTSGGGSGGGHTTADTVIKPSTVGNFKAQGAESQIALSWDNPQSSEWVRTIIVRKTDGIPVSPKDGTVIYEGVDSSFVDTDLNNKTTYYYSAFTINRKAEYSNSLSLSLHPQSGVTQIVGEKVFAKNVASSASLLLTGRLIKYEGDLTVYLLKDSIKYPITRYEIYQTNYQNRPIATLSDGEQYPSGEVLRFGPGTLLKGSGSAVWLIIDDGSRYAFRSQEEFYRFGYRFDLIKTVSDEELESYPLSGIETLRFHGTTNFIKYQNDPTVFMIENNTKRGLTSPQVYFSYAGSWDEVLVIPNDIVYATGDILSYPDGMLIKGFTDTVYYIENGLKKAFRSEEALFSRGYQFSDILAVPDSDLSLNTTGEELDL